MFRTIFGSRADRPFVIAFYALAALIVIAIVATLCSARAPASTSEWQCVTNGGCWAVAYAPDGTLKRMHFPKGDIVGRDQVIGALLGPGWKALD
jgi:hypothetical protein